MVQPLNRTLRTWRGYTRAALIAGGVILVLSLVFQVAAPFLISTALVRNSMEDAVEEWFGHDATIAGDPELHFWPRPQIVLTDITIRENENPSSRVIAHVDRLAASFALYQAIRGQPVFRDFELDRPMVLAIRSATGDIDWSMDGILNDAIQEVRTNRADQGTSAKVLETAIGDVSVTDGTIEITDAVDGKKTTIRSINGTVDWPELSSAIAFNLTGNVASRTFTLGLSSSQPLVLLAGRNADVELSLSSDLFSGQFSGTANLASYAFLSGSFNVIIPDMSAALDWAGINVTGMDRLQRVSLRSKLVTTGNAIRFEQVNLQANEASATGIMDLVATDSQRPRLTGTLAFDRLDFSAILSALSPKPKTAGDEDVTPTVLLADTLDLDVRLSASEAQLGPLPLRNAAVSMMNTRQLARIDLVDSSIDGGRLTGQISAADGKVSDSADLKLFLRDADLASVARRLGASTIIPEATGSAELALHLDKPLGMADLNDISGSLRLSAREGRLSGIDIAAIRRLAGQSAYFALNDVSDGNIFFSTMTMSATIAQGVAELGEARLDGPDDLIVLSGMVPLETRGLALSANVYAKTDGTPSNDPLMVFIGGAWPAPVFWPMTKP